MRFVYRTSLTAMYPNPLSTLRRIAVRCYYLLAILLLPAELSGWEYQEGPHGEPAGELTPRELATLKALAEGLSNHEIANELGVSLNTVQTHLRHIYQKLGVDSRAQAILWYVHHLGTEGTKDVEK